MSKKWLAMAAVVVLGGGAVALASGDGDEADGRRGKRGAALQERLGLSDAQAEQLRQLHANERKAQVRRHADIKVANVELQELLAAPSVDEQAVAAKVKQLSDLHAGGLKARVDRQLALRQILSPEQYQQLSQMRHRKGHGRREPRMRRGPGGPGPEGSEPGPEVEQQ